VAKGFSHSRLFTPAISSGGLLEQYASLALAARLNVSLTTTGMTHVREAHVCSVPANGGMTQLGSSMAAY